MNRGSMIAMATISTSMQIMMTLLPKKRATLFALKRLDLFLSIA